MNETYKLLLDDYIHIVLNHNHEINDIYNIIISSKYKMNKCQISNCLLAIRHNRDKTKDTNYDDDDKLVIFYRDVIY